MRRTTRRKRGTTRRLVVALRAVVPGGSRGRGSLGGRSSPAARLSAGVSAGVRRVRSAVPGGGRGRGGSGLGGGRSGTRRRGSNRGGSGLGAAAGDSADDASLDYALATLGVVLGLSGIVIGFVSSNLLVVALANVLLFAPVAYRYRDADDGDRSRRGGSRSSVVDRLRARVSRNDSVERL